MGSHKLKFKPTDFRSPASEMIPITCPAPQGPYHILALDGGGIRGLSILYILQALMGRIRTRKRLGYDPRPCEYFHLIVGTSTGGLIALMLGRLKMSVDQAIDAYINLSREIFVRGNIRYWMAKVLFWSSIPRYSAGRLERAIRKVVEDSPQRFRAANTVEECDQDIPLRDPDCACRVAVVAVQKRAAANSPYLLRTYDTHTGSIPCTIVDAARATTAATTFFPSASVEVEHQLRVRFLDGGLGHNNPTRLAKGEAEKIWPNCHFGTIVSIGTGESGYNTFRGDKLTLGGKLAQIVTSCKLIHDGMKEDFKERPGIYYRFNVPTDLNRIGLDEWRKKRAVGEITFTYMEDHKGELDDCVAVITSSPTARPVTTIQRDGEQQSINNSPLSEPFQGRNNVIKDEQQHADIPPLPESFGGRYCVMDDILSALQKGQRVAITGYGGMGKSTVATAILHHSEMEKFGQRRFFVRCDQIFPEFPPIRSTNVLEKFISILATSLNIREPDGSTSKAVVDFLTRHPSILVLDNMETLYDIGGKDLDEFIRRLLRMPKLGLVITIRGKMLPANDEPWYRVELGELDPESARQVFMKAQGSDQPPNKYLDKLLMAVGYLPLAIVLLAAQAEGYPNHKGLWKDWKRLRTKLLKDGRYRTGQPNNLDIRLLSVEASIELSLSRATMKDNPSARKLLSQLSLLPDGVALDDLASVFPSAHLGPEEIRPEVILRRLSLAYNDHPVVNDTQAGTGEQHPLARLRTHACTREYIRRLDNGEGNQAADSPSSIPDWKTYLVAHYLTLAKQGGDDNALKYNLFRPEVNNIEAVISWALTCDDHEIWERATESAAAMCEFGAQTGVTLPLLVPKFSEIICRVKDVGKQAYFMRCLGRIFFRHKNFEDALKWFDKAILLYNRVHDRRGKAYCINGLAEVALSQHRHADAQELFQEAIPLYDEVYDLQRKAHCIRGLAEVALAQNKHADAQERFKAAIPLYNEVHDLRRKARCIRGLAEVALHRHKYADAQQWFQEAIPLYDEVHDLPGKAHCIRGLAEVAFSLRRHVEAQELFKEAIPLYDEVDDWQRKAHCIRGLAEVALDRDELANAQRWFQEAIPLYDEVDDLQRKAHCIRGLGRVALRQHKHAGAQRSFEAAMILYDKIEDLQGKGHCIRGLGEVALDRHENANARRWFDEAMTLYDKLEDAEWKAWCSRRIDQIEAATTS